MESQSFRLIKSLWQLKATGVLKTIPANPIVVMLRFASLTKSNVLLGCSEFIKTSSIEWIQTVIKQKVRVSSRQTIQKTLMGPGFHWSGLPRILTTCPEGLIASCLINLRPTQLFKNLTLKGLCLLISIILKYQQTRKIKISTRKIQSIK